MTEKSWFELGPGADTKIDPPTKKQLDYLASLRAQAGEGQAPPLPKTKAAAAKEIERLRQKTQDAIPHYHGGATDDEYLDPAGYWPA